MLELALDYWRKAHNKERYNGKERAMMLRQACRFYALSKQ